MVEIIEYCWKPIFTGNEGGQCLPLVWPLRLLLTTCITHLLYKSMLYILITDATRKLHRGQVVGDI